MIINDYKIQLYPEELGLGQVPVPVNVDQAEQLLAVSCCLRIIIIVINIVMMYSCKTKIFQLNLFFLQYNLL